MWRICKRTSKKSTFFKKLSYVFTIPLILSNVTTLVLNAWGGDDNDLEIKITTMSVLGINALASGFKSYLKFDEKMQYNTEKAISYEKLAEKIESSLVSRRPKFGFDELTEEKINIIEHDTYVYKAVVEEAPKPVPEPIPEMELIEVESEPTTPTTSTRTPVSDHVGQQTAVPSDLSDRSSPEVSRSDIKVNAEEPLPVERQGDISREEIPRAEKKFAKTIRVVSRRNPVIKNDIASQILSYLSEDYHMLKCTKL